MLHPISLALCLLTLSWIDFSHRAPYPYLKAHQAFRRECSQVCYHLPMPEVRAVLLVRQVPQLPPMPQVRAVRLDLLRIKHWYVLDNFLAIVLTFLFRKTVFKPTCQPSISVSLPGRTSKQKILVFPSKFALIVQYTPRRSHPIPPILPSSSFSSSTNLSLIWILSLSRRANHPHYASIRS